MTNRYLTWLRTATVAVCAAAIVLVPVTSAVGVGRSIDDRTANGLRLKDESVGRQSDDKIQTVRMYGRSNYVWPYATGPKYFAPDPAAEDTIITPAGSFQLRGPLGIPDQLRTAYKLDTQGAQHFVVQFDEGALDATMEAIQTSGGAIVGSTGNGLVARLSHESYNAVRATSGVSAVEPYHAAFKLNYNIGRTPIADPIKATSDIYDLDVVLWPGEDSMQVAEALRAIGANVLQVFGDTVRIEISRTKLAEVAGLEPVQVVYEHLQMHKLAEETTTTMQTGQYNGGAIPYHDAGIDGSGGATGVPQILMVLDSGIQLDAGDLSDSRTDAGTAGPTHRKVRVYESTNQFGGSGDTSGCDAGPQGGFSHGHVVSATALGWASDIDQIDYNGIGWVALDQQGNPWKLDGVAPGALLVAYDAQVTPPNGSCSDPLLDSIVPGDLYLPGAAGGCPGVNCPGSLGVAYESEGARIFNFSWGAPTNTYSANASDIDRFILDKEDAMVFVSAGNAGADNVPPNGDGVPDENTLGTPATTKNGLAIGASRNANIVNSPNSREFFSSMGPAVDTTVNRIAPQLMAPGGEPGGGSLGVSSEFSCRSNDNNQTNPVECDIITGVEGTSFSSPAAAGAALLVRDYFRQGYYPDGAPNVADEVHTISGALVKALLIASADWMENLDAPFLTRAYRFNNEQGYGRIQLDNVLPLSSWARSPSGLIVHDAGLTGGGASNLTLPLEVINGTNATATFNVCDDKQDLAIVLAWSDAMTGSGNLANDLNLEVTSPSGIKYRGNYFSDDNDRDGVPEGTEDCGGIGAADIEVGDGLINASEWTLPDCSKAGLPGTFLSVRPYDNANPTEAIFLSHDPEDDDDTENPGDVGEGTCTVGLNPCNNNLDCAGGADVCENPDDYRQTEAGDWTIRIFETGNPTAQKYAVAIAGGVCLGSAVRFDDGVYTCNEKVKITVSEIEDPPFDAAPTATAVENRTVVNVLSNGVVMDTEADLSFLQTGPTSFESAELTLSAFTAYDPGNGVLDVRSGDEIQVVYADIDGDTGGPGAVRTNIAAVRCDPGVNFGSFVFAQYGQDSQVLTQGGCERNARGQFEFGFPDRYMDAGETIIYNFQFNSTETIDLEQVTASIECVYTDQNSPADCLPNGAGCDPTECGGTCDPLRLDNDRCDQAANQAFPHSKLMTIVDPEQIIGFVPAAENVSANFTIQMEGDGAGQYFEDTGGGQPTPFIEMVLRVSAATSGYTSTGVAFNRHRLNVDEVSVFYSTDFPTGGTEVVDSGPGEKGNNNEIAEDPITEIGNFQTNDYRFETQVFGDLTQGGRNANLLSPWHFDGNDGNFSVGLAGPSDETAADVFNIANWGEDKNFNGIEDGVCLNDPGTACYSFGFNTDPRCGTNGTCSSVENNAGGTQFVQNWNMKGGCGWQTKPPGTCSGSTGANPRGCYDNEDCGGHCQVLNNAIASTFDVCGSGNGACPQAFQCSSLSENPLAPCTSAADCDLSNDGGIFDTCDAISQTCVGDAGSCGGGALATGGIWHTGAIGTTGLACDGGPTSACANYKIISGIGGQLIWWELLTTPVMEKVNQNETNGVPDAQAEIFDWAWNQQINLRDDNVAYTWELDTDTTKLEPLDLYADGTILNLGFGDYGAVENSNNPFLTRGFSMFAPIATCRTEGGANTNRPCHLTEDCAAGVCNGGGNTPCYFDADCLDASDGTICNGEETCVTTAAGTSVNGTLGNSRVGKNACFFEGPGTIPVNAQKTLGIAQPQDDDRDNDADTFIDEFVTPAGPYRNHDIVAWNGPDMRFNTLEDIYGDTGNTFQAALGFVNFEGTPTNQAQPSYGLGVDDMVVKWREFTLQEDQTDCAAGNCASIDVGSTNVYNGNSTLTVLLTENSPSYPNDCNLAASGDGNPGNVSGVCTGCDCDGNGVPDLPVRAFSQAEQSAPICANSSATDDDKSVCREVIIANLVPGTDNQYSGQLTISSLGDTDGNYCKSVDGEGTLPKTCSLSGGSCSTGDDCPFSPGILFVSEQGGDNPFVTVEYFDSNDGTGNVCKNDVDPTKWGFVAGGTTVFIDQTCEITVVGTVISDNGDNDLFPDTGETVDMQISYINNCGIPLNNCAARISTNSPTVDCILNPVIDLGDLEPGTATITSTNAFTWKVGDDVERLNVNDVVSASFNVTMSCDEIDALSVPQSVSLGLDLDLDDLGQTPAVWSEDFESATLGKFVAENIDAGLPGNNNSEGLINSDGWRCQYSDPDWPNAASYGSPQAADCYPGNNLAHADAIFWQVDGSTIVTSPDGGRGFTGTHSMYYGVFLTTPAGNFSSPLATVESVRTSAPINLGLTGPILSYWQQISLTDDRSLGTIPPLRSADRGVVQIQVADESGVPAGPWERLEPFQNAFDEQAVDNYFNCSFDPIDDGNTEDDFFDPTDPDRRTGPSSTCFPEVTFGYQGDTDAPFAVDAIGNAQTPPAATDSPDFGTGTWVEARADLSEYLGRRVRLRFLVSALKATQENWEGQFAHNPTPADDGWWIDQVNVSDTLPQPAALTPDVKTTRHCAGNADIGCQSDQDCVDQGTSGPCTGEAPQCGAICNTVTVNVATVPDSNAMPLTETLPAPGQVIEVNAVASFADRCLDGTLQYQFSADGVVEQAWSDSPIFIAAPQQDVDITVQVRCSSAPTTCNASSVIAVTVDCPSSGTLGGIFQTIFGNKGANTFVWANPVDYEAWSGPLSSVSSYGGASLPSGSGTSFPAGANPGVGTGNYYLAKSPGGFFCNETGVWSSGGSGEQPGREAALP